MARASPLVVWAAAAVGLSALLVAALLIGGFHGPGGAGAGGVPFTAGGLTVKAMSCPSKDNCIIDVGLSGSQAATLTLTPDGVKQVSGNTLTSTSSITITADPPKEWAVYSIVAEPGPGDPVTLKGARLTGWGSGSGATTATFYLPIISSPATGSSGAGWSPGTPSSVTVAAGSMVPQPGNPTASGCNAYKPSGVVQSGLNWNWNSLVRTGSDFFGNTFYEYMCASAWHVGEWGRIDGPQYGYEATLYFNGQPVKVGSGNFGAAPTVAIVPLGTATFGGTLATGLSAPVSSLFAAVWFFDDNQWRIVPANFQYDAQSVLGGPVNSYLLGQATNTIPSPLNPQVFSPLGTSGIWSAGWSFFSQPTDSDRWAQVLKMMTLGSPVDMDNVNLRAFNNVVCGGQATQATQTLCALSPHATGNSGTATIISAPQGVSWGNPDITLTLNAAGISALGIKIYGGTPANVHVSGTASAAGAGVLTVSAQNVGGDGNFDFSATCQGAYVAGVQLPAPAGQTITANLQVSSTGTQSLPSIDACTATVTDHGTAASATGTGTLTVSGTKECIPGIYVEISTQSAELCDSTGHLGPGLTCGAGQGIIVSGSTASCVSTAAAGGGSVLPPPGPSAVLATAAPSGGAGGGGCGAGGFCNTGPPWWVLPVVIVAVAGIIAAAIVFSRRRPPMEGM